jgi:hypothetical protein
MLETFVERDRFAGTCYRAANWQRLGSTRGRSRQDSARDLRVPVKEVYAYPLRLGLAKGVDPMSGAELQDQFEQLQERYRALEEENTRLQAELALKEGIEAQLQEALLELAELKRQLFGERRPTQPGGGGSTGRGGRRPSGEAQQEPPVSEEVLEDQTEQESQENDSAQRRRPRARTAPSTSSPAGAPGTADRGDRTRGAGPCEHCGRPLNPSGRKSARNWSMCRPR